MNTRTEFYGQKIYFNVNFKFLDIVDDNRQHDVYFDSFSKSVTLLKHLKNPRFINKGAIRVNRSTNSYSHRKIREESSRHVVCKVSVR